MDGLWFTTRYWGLCLAILWLYHLPAPWVWIRFRSFTLIAAILLQKWCCLAIWLSRYVALRKLRSCPMPLLCIDHSGSSCSTIHKLRLDLAFDTVAFVGVDHYCWHLFFYDGIWICNVSSPHCGLMCESDWGWLIWMMHLVFHQIVLS